MRVMTDVARSVLASYVFVVFSEALIAQDAVAAVTAIAKRIIGRTLGCIVERPVISDENGLELRTMRSFGT